MLNRIELTWTQIEGEIAADNRLLKMVNVKLLLFEAILNIDRRKWENYMSHFTKEKEKICAVGGLIDNPNTFNFKIQLCKWRFAKSSTLLEKKKKTEHSCYLFYFLYSRI